MTEPTSAVERMAQHMYNTERPSGTDWWIEPITSPDDKVLYRLKAHALLQVALGVHGGTGIFGTDLDLSALDEDTALRLGIFTGELIAAAHATGVEAGRRRAQEEAPNLKETPRHE